MPSIETGSGLSYRDIYGQGLPPKICGYTGEGKQWLK